MLAKILSGALIGLEAVPVTVEVDIASQGLPSFTIVGLPDKAVEESRERVRAAIKNSGADFPPRRITVNLAPADLPKEGPAYDVPIALGILIASGQLSAPQTDMLFFGELSLEGTIRHTAGVLSLALLARKNKISGVFIPAANVNEAAIIEDITVYPTESLRSLIDHMTGIRRIIPSSPVPLSVMGTHTSYDIDMSDICGQEHAKRAAEIAVSGGHNMLLHGPPGAGKTLLARAIRSILPELTAAEAIEVTQIYSVAGLLNAGQIIHERPYRSPHHTTSRIGLIGGGSYPRPGEISLAHRGLLFLDEILEFPRSVLEALRQPVEDGMVTVSRAAGTVTFPAKFMLIAAANPCPCGYYGSPQHMCTCSAAAISRYQGRLSGPLLDRIDLHVSLPAISVEDLTKGTGDRQMSVRIQETIRTAREKQAKRYRGMRIKTNAELNSRQVKTYCHLSPAAAALLQKGISVYQLSARGYYRIIRTSQTIADLGNSDIIEASHVAEAFQYRARAFQQS